MPYPDVNNLSPYRLEEIDDLITLIRDQPPDYSREDLLAIDKGTTITLTKVEFSRLVLTAYKGARTANKKPVR